MVQAEASEVQAARGFWGGPRGKKVKYSWCQLAESSTDKNGASERA